MPLTVASPFVTQMMCYVLRQPAGSAKPPRLLDVRVPLVEDKSPLKGRVNKAIA
jgi:hypothetical protein